MVTGGASGIDLAVVQRFAAEGTHVVITDRNDQAAESAVTNPRKIGAPIGLASLCDVSIEAQVKATVDATIKQYGRLDVVVNNAGLMTFHALSVLTHED